MLRGFACLFVAAACFAVPALASRITVPYSGTLKRAGLAYTGKAEMKFAIIDEASVLWSNAVLDAQGLPRQSTTIQVTQGNFSVSLGMPPMNQLDAYALDGHPGAILRVWVSTGGAFEQLSDQPFASQQEGPPSDQPADRVHSSQSAPTTSSGSASSAAGVPSAVWSLKGNRGSNGAIDFIGTTDDEPVVIKTNSTPAVTIGSSGPIEVHKALIVNGDETVRGDQNVNGSVHIAGGLMADGASHLGGLTLEGGNLQVAGEATAKCITILGGCDLSEPFSISTEGADGLEPGMVVSIDPNHPGELRLVSEPYDRKVAGVISGANGLAPGLVMKSIGNALADGTHVVALSGRVWCWVDASFGAVHPGDMLTTSSTPGMAMAARDSRRRQGAILGKAMSSLEYGRGLVLMLVSLQ
jgi:hypothetical protein